MNQYNDDNTNDEILGQLKELNDLFGRVVLEYVYEAPSTDAETKTMTLNHTYNIEFDEETAAEITEKIAAIRNGIIKA